MPDTAAFLDSLYEPATCGVRFFRNGHVTLLGTAFAAQTHYALGSLDPEIAPALRSFLTKSQLDNGEFSDPTFVPAETRGSHDAEYIRWQTTFFVLSALDALGSPALRPPAFIAPLLDASARERWFAARDWDNFWLSSNEIMFLLFFLTYLAERHGSHPAREAAFHVLDLLDRRQDPLTGFWGSESAGLGNRMYGAAHVYMFYDYYGRPIRHAERIIDTTLALQRPSGLYGRDDGGACEDYDAVEILTKVGRQTAHRQGDVRRSLLRTADVIRGRRDLRTGGYSYRLAPAGVVARLARRWRGKRYSYSGWSRMTCNVYEPDTWATFFRVLALLAIAREIGEPADGRSSSLPTWGYFARQG